MTQGSQHPAAEANEERLHLVLQATHAGLYDLNLETGEAQFTPEYAEMLGYDPATFRLDLERWASWLHPEDRERTLAILQSCIRGEVPGYECQFRIRTRTGEWKWIQSSGKVATRGPAGRPLRMIGTHTDITERQRTEMALRESEQRFRQTFENNRAVMLLVDPDSGAIRDANPAAAAFYGYTREALCRMAIEEINLLRPEQVKLSRLQALSQPPGHFVFPHRLASGEIRTVEVYSSPLEVGGHPLLISIVHDITERDRAETALRETEFFLTKSQEITRLGSYKFDIAAGAWSCTRVLDEIFGVDASYPKTIDGWLELVAPADREGMRQHLLQHVVAEHNRFDREYRIIRYHDRQERWVHGLGELQFDAQGRPRHMIGTIQDITERKETERFLREAEGLYRAIFQTSPDGMAVLDLAGRVTFVSQKALAVFGVGSAEAAKGRPMTDFVSPQDHGRIREAFDGVMRGRYRAASQYSLRRADGSTFVGEINAAVMHNAEGKPTGMLTITRDVSDRVRANAALRDREARLASVIRASPLGIGVLVNRVMQDVNEAACRISGYAREEMVGHSARFLYPTEEEYAAVGGMYRDLAALGAAALETRWRRKDGALRHILLNAAPLDPQDLAQGVTFAALDYTERRLAEEALRNSERKLAEIFRASPEFISVSTVAEGRILDFNETFTNLLGFGRDEAVGRTSLEIGLWPTPADRERVVSLVREQGRIQNLEVQWRKKSGELVDVLMSMAPIAVEGQACLVTIAADIGERKRAEQARLEMERRLLHAQKLESLGVLAGGIAHDFNNLLMAILGNLDLALMDLSPVSPARFSIEQSALAARRAADLTRQMLAYSGRASFEVRRINLSELVEENAHLLRTCISKIVRLNLDLDRGLPVVNADSGQIQQVIMNLITNASEAIGDRPGAISLSTGVQACDAAALARSRVEAVLSPGRYVYLEVADTGCGMDPPTQLRLFDPFFTTKSMGRGLGMSAILGIVRGHQGAIFVDSTVGQGTTIRVLFPAGEMPQPGERARAPAGAAAGPGDPPRATEGTILVVDDEDMVRNVCAHILRRIGWQVIAAANGPEAIRLFRERAAEIDCVILDQSMPEMNGLTVFRELRALQPGVKVVLSSGYSSAHGPGQSLAAEGLAGFIQKPYSLDGLREELARVLHRAG